MKFSEYWRRHSGKFGAIIMLGFGSISTWRWIHTGLLFFALLAIRDLTASWFLLVRRSNGSSFQRGALTAYISSALPLCYFSATPEAPHSTFTIAATLSIVGFLLATFAVLELGKSFGVAPANRGRVASGIYRYARHPMYAGYAIAEAGFVLFNPLNAALFILSITGYLIRAKAEDSLFSNSRVEANERHTLNVL